MTGDRSVVGVSLRFRTSAIVYSDKGLKPLAPVRLGMRQSDRVNGRSAGKLAGPIQRSYSIALLTIAR